MIVARQAKLIDPLISFDEIDRVHLNRCLQRWEHRMGPLHRPFAQFDRCFALFHEAETVAVVAHSRLIGAVVAGISREQACEVARVCAARPDLCRVVLRLWREFVFPSLKKPWAISYQDAALHSGHLYRFDGWVRLGSSRSGTDARGGGRKGRSKVIWGWCADASVRKSVREAESS